MTSIRLGAFASFAILLFAGLALAGCTTGGGALSAGLVARMDRPGATLDRTEALAIINDYRARSGAAPLVADASLDSTAQTLASQYAATGTPPKRPAGSVEIRYSAGYFTFAETFSGWRNSKADAAVLALSGASRAGLAAVYSGSSSYGTYWVLVLG